jgi:multicomponent Na+:H+ antiporter subunit B
MTAKVRVAIFVVAAAGFALFLIWGLGGLPSFGHYPGPYGPQVDQQAYNSRHATNAVTTVVMDIRGVDTAGEELILLAAVVGVLMLLREQRNEDAELPPAEHRDPARVDVSNAVGTAAMWLVAPAAMLGLYVVGHGQLTPGGGFQGGIVLGVPSALVLLSGRRKTFDRWHSPLPWEIAQAIAVFAFLGLGFAGLASSRHAFLANFLPYGVTGTEFSAGTIEILNVIAGVAVSTAVVLLLVALLHQITAVRRR